MILRNKTILQDKCRQLEFKHKNQWNPHDLVQNMADDLTEFLKKNET